MTLPDELRGRWIHAHEESGADLVFRRGGTPLPPSRGRAAFDFRDDGVFAEHGPGPADTAQTVTGRWSLDNDTLKLSYGDDRPDQSFKVRSARDALILTRQ